MKPSTINASLASRQRLEFIECLAVWEGRVRPAEVIRAFNVSKAQASNDFTAYQRLRPDNLRYDTSKKTYVPTESFSPAYNSCSPDTYLALLVFAQSDLSNPTAKHVADRVPHTHLPTVDASLDEAVLKQVVRAIVQKRPLTLLYQSLREPKPRSRLAWPTSLVHTGIRWHVRGYDSERGEYRDFVIQRILKAEQSDDKSHPALPQDTDWETYQTLMLVPNPNASASQQEVIAKQFGMTLANGRWVKGLKMRTCLIPYFVHSHRLESPSASAVSSPVILENVESVRHLLFQKP